MVLEIGATALYPLVQMLQDKNEYISMIVMFALGNFFCETIPSKLHSQLESTVNILLSPILEILSVDNTKQDLMLTVLRMLVCFLSSGFCKPVDKANVCGQIPKLLLHYPTWDEVPKYALMIIGSIDESDNKQVKIS
jgi:hypothetical protein